MASSARLVTIKRSGDDGAHFPLTLSSCVFGRSIECDIRIQLPVVSKKHCKIEVKEQEAILYNFSSVNPTQVNGATIDEPVQLKHGDIITIIDRSFRYENGSHEDGSKSTGFPRKSLGQEPARRTPRANFSADPGGKDQDAKTSKITASRRSLVDVKRLPGDSPSSDGSKSSVTQDLPNTHFSGHVEQHSDRNIGEQTSGGLFKETSRATGISYRELRSSPAQSLSNSKKNDSPFEKLYQSMKEELYIKSQKQSRRKSEPQPDCPSGKESWETQLLVSCKSRPKSSGSTLVTATSSPRVVKVSTEKQISAVGPVQTSTEALSSSFSLPETAKTKTPRRNSQQLKDEDFPATGRRESVSLDESEIAKAVRKIVTPRKLGTRNETSVKVEDAASSADAPESLSSKKRRSVPAKVEVLSAETQNQLSSTQHLAPGKSEGMSLKRRHVSFGGRLRPELFDENLPPNTPLKRGEIPTKRKSLDTHTPAVLKKIIKERPQSPGKQESPGITPSRANDQRRRSGRTLPASSGSKYLEQTDIPKKGGRKSSNLPAKRASISRSQHDILQMICSKRRSGASEANLIVAKSWADVVKLGVKQTQTKVVKQASQKQISKRQRRPNTPKNPTSSLRNQFGTGHANSPCTIVIGRAQIEKVNMPAQPYKMLNNLMLNRKMDFSEDLSGLTEMFKTPVKEKQQQMNDMGSILSNSENLPEKQFQVTNSEEKTVFSRTQNLAKEPPDKYSASPTLRRRSIKNANIVQTPKNIHSITHFEKKTPGSVTEPLKTISSSSRLRRSRELRHTLVESKNEETEVSFAESITGRHLRKTSLQGEDMEQQVQNGEHSSQRCKENIELKEDPEKTLAMRSSTREPTKGFIGSQMITQTAACAEELLNQEKGTTQKSEESTHMENTAISDDQSFQKLKGAIKQKVDLVYPTKVKRRTRTPDKKTHPVEGPTKPFETPKWRCEPIGDDKTKVPCESPQLITENTKTSTKPRPSTSGKKIEPKEEHSLQNELVHMAGGSRCTAKVPELEHSDIKVMMESKNQMLDHTLTSSKRLVGKAKEKNQPLEDLAGFQKPFLSPIPGDKITKMPNKSPQPEAVRTPASTKRLSNTGLRKVDVREELSTLGKGTQSPGRTTHIPTAPVQEENDTTTFMETPKQKLDFTGDSTGRKRRSRTSKVGSQPLEDLDGLQELFQTPASASDPVTVEKTAKMPLQSPHPEAVRTPASTKRLSKMGLRKVDVREELSTLGKGTQSPGRAARIPTAPVQEENDTTTFMETPKQKLDFTGDSTGHKRRSRTSKVGSQPLEDLDGLQELFQTPAGASDPVTVEKTAKMPLQSPHPEAVRTPASTKKLSKTGLRKVDVREELSTLGKGTQSPGRTARIPTAPVQEENDTTAFMETPKQKLDFTGDSTDRKRRSRTSKVGSQPLEDLDGLQELFQTPAGASDPVTVEKTAKMPLKSPHPEAVRTPASTKRLSKMGLRKVDVREELSTLGKGTQSPGRSAHIPTAPVQEENDTTTFMETPKQKLDFTGDSTDRKRRSRTSKVGSQPLEDLDGLQELFQTPAGASDPVTVEKTAKMPLKSPYPEAVRTPASTKRQSRASMGKMATKEEPSELEKHPQTGKAIHTLQVPDINKIIKASKQSAKRKLDPTASVPGSKRLRHTPKDKTLYLEDLSGFQQLFQTPGHPKDSLTVAETSKMPSTSPQSRPVSTQTSRKSLPKISLQKMDVTEELSAAWKQSVGITIHTHTTPVQQDNGIKAIMETPKEKLETGANVSGLMRQPQAPKEKVQSLEDLDGFQELFQTPGHGTDPLTGNKRTRVSLKSPQPILVRIPQTSKRLPKTSLGKVGVKEEQSLLNMPSQAIGEVVHIPRLAEDGDRGSKDMKESTVHTLDPLINVTGSKRQRGAQKVRSEDLFSLQELFQTPANDKDPITVGETTKMSLESSQPGHIRTPASTKRLSKMGLRKVDVREELSKLGKGTQSPGRTAHIPTAPVQEENDTTAFMETPKQKLDFTGDSTDRKRRSRTSKVGSQPLEDLDGLQELFQTPAGASDPVTVEKTAKMPLQSPHPEAVRTPASTKRLSKMGLRKVDVREELSTLGKGTRSPGRSAHIPTAPVQEENDTTTFMETPKQKLDFTGDSTDRKRRSRTSKVGSQPLEDLDGLQELFQTPAGASDPVTVEKTAKMPLKSPHPEAVRTPASTKRLSKMGLRKVDVREELSTLGKGTQSPGRAARIPTAPVQEENDTTTFMETPKQKLDFTGDSTDRKRRSRTSKVGSQPLEDLDGLQELFQTPAGASDPVTVEKTAKMPLQSPHPEAVRTPVSTSLRKADGRKELSELNKPRCISQAVMHTPTLPEYDSKGNTDVKESAAQTLEAAVSVTRSKRLQGTSKNTLQSPEDLFDLQKLFQTPGHNKDSVADEKLTKPPCRSPPTEPIQTSVTSQRQLRISLKKVHVKNELSGDRTLPQMSGEIMGTSTVAEGEDKGIRTRKQSAKRKLDTAVSVPGSKRRRVAQDVKAQPLEDLPGFQELNQTPGSAVDSMIVGKTVKMPSKSPESVDTTSKTQPGKRLIRVHVAKEPIAQRKMTRVLRETRNTQKEPGDDNKGVKELKKSSTEKQDPAISLIGRRNQPRASKKKTQPLEELISFQEEAATRMSYKSLGPEEKETPAASKRQLRIQLCKVSVKEEPTAQRKPPGRQTRNSLKDPMGDSGNVEELKESTKRKTDPAASVPISKRPRRVPRQKAQPLELAGPKGLIQTPGHSEESASDKRPTQMPCSSLQPEQIDSLQTSPRRPRTRRWKADEDEKPSVVRKTVPASRQTTRSHKIPESDDKGTQASQEPVKQKLDTVANVTGSRRQLRGPKVEVQSLEVLGDSKEITQISNHTEKLEHDTSSLKSTLQQMPESVKPLRPSRRGLRSSKENPMEMSVDTKDHAASQSKSNALLPPIRKSARDENVLRTRGLRSVTTKEKVADEKPAPKKQRAAPSKRHMAPEPVVMVRHLRTLPNKTEPVEEQISNMKTDEKETKVENSVAPDQRMPLSCRYRKKANEKQPGSEVGASAEKVEIKKNKKTVKTSQETELQNLDEGDKKSTSVGKVSGKITCLRSRGQSKIPQSHAAEEKTSKKDTEILMKTQKEKVSGDTDGRCLRSRKTGATLDNEPKPRVTRGAEKAAKIPKKDEDIVDTKKLRTRSGRNGENM